MKDLRIEIYSDGADINQMIEDLNSGLVTGFTTNPTLMAKAGISDYMNFAKEVLAQIKEHSISFEVFTDELDQMEEQALILSSLAENVFVKIPVMNTRGQSTYELIKSLSEKGVKLNVTAIFTKPQINEVIKALGKNVPSIVSIFAGRIANAGIDPEPFINEAVSLSRDFNEMKILWASSREVFNIIQAERCGCDIITLTPALIKAAQKDLNKDLTQFSQETVQMFYDDALNSGYRI